MTERLAETNRRLASLQQLDAVVTAMRGIAASRVQQAHGLLPGVRAYAEVVGGAIGQALALAPSAAPEATNAAHRTAIVLFSAEQGFAGAFSERMLAAITPLPEAADLFLIGTRGAALVEERGVRFAWRTPMVPQASLVPVLAERIARALYAWVTDHAAARVEMVVPVWSAAGGVGAARRTLLPFDFRRFKVAATGQAPLVTLPPARLLAQLAVEYVFSELCEAACLAFAAENEARVAAMLAAGSNLKDMRADLTGLARLLRQAEITAEVVELASGAAAR